MMHLPSTERCVFLVLALSLVAWLPPAALAAPAGGLTLDAVKRAPAAVVGAEGVAPKDVRVVREPRNWRNGRLWWNDPDCVVLTGEPPDDEYRFHATALYATGGMLLSGDDLTKISPSRLAMLRKLLSPTGVAAEFEDEALRVGRVRLKGRTAVCLLNWGDRPAALSFRLPGPCCVTDFWTGAGLGRHEGAFEVKDVPKHSARLLVCEPLSP